MLLWKVTSQKLLANSTLNMGEGERNTCIGKNVIFPKYYELDCLKNEKKKKRKKEMELPIEMGQFY